MADKSITSFYDLQHAPDPVDGHCHCGHTLRVTISLDDKPVQMEAHSSGYSLLAARHCDSGGYTLFREQRNGDVQIPDRELGKPIILRDGDAFYVVPRGIIGG